MLATMNFFSTVQGMNSTMHVVLPDAYDANGCPAGRKDPCPVLYLLHDNGDNHTKWLRYTSVERYANQAGIAVVMPAVNQGLYADMAEGYNFFSFLTEELPRIIQRDFPKISACPEDTFAAGAGIGGFGALKWAFTKPGKIAAAASLSSYLEPQVMMALAESDPVLYKKMERAWGPEDLVSQTENDLASLIAAAKAEGPLPKIWLGCTKSDPALFCNESFAKQYGETLDVTCCFEDGPEDHWSFWDRQIEKVISWLPIDR